MNKVWFPSVEFILLLYNQNISGERQPLMNVNGLQSTIDQAMHGIPFQSTPTLWDRVTIIYKEIVENHYFIDGNKRMGVLVAVIFLNLNGYEFSPPVGEIFSVTMDVAQIKMGFDQIKSWFQSNSTKY